MIKNALFLLTFGFLSILEVLKNDNGWTSFLTTGTGGLIDDDCFLTSTAEGGRGGLEVVTNTSSSSSSSSLSSIICFFRFS